MKSHRSHAEEILLHSEDADEIATAMIEYRAHELAIIKGRYTVSPADRHLVSQELQGRELPGATWDGR